MLNFSPPVIKSPHMRLSWISSTPKAYEVRERLPHANAITVETAA